MKLKYSAKAHGYWLDGKRCKSPSAIAKVPDDSSALDKWRRRQTALGLAVRPELLTEIAANPDDKKAIDQICERAMDHAGASSGRNWGSAVHLAVERTIGGHRILETAEMTRIREQWGNLLADHDLEVIATESVVVHPERHIAGRFDQLVRHTKTGDILVGDLKTGAEAGNYLHAHCVQLWLYASAPFTGVGPAGDNDFEIEQFDPMPEGVSQTVGLVFHMPQDGTPSVIPVDIAAGGHCFTEVIEPTWRWRNRGDLRAQWGEPPKVAKGAAKPQPRRIEPLHPVTVTVTPDEGPDVDVTATRAAYQWLTQEGRVWIGTLWDQARKGGCDFQLTKEIHTMRRARIYDGLIDLAEGDACDADAVKALCRLVTDDEALMWPTVPAGVAVGSLGATQAAAFVVACDLFIAGRYAWDFTIHPARLVEVAA